MTSLKRSVLPQWRWKLADTLSEARRRLPGAIAETDELIDDLRAGKPQKAPSNQMPRQLAKDLLAGKPASEVFNSPDFLGSPEEAEAISELPPTQLGRHSTFHCC